jgi:hypothetical protein
MLENSLRQTQDGLWHSCDFDCLLSGHGLFVLEKLEAIQS